MGGPLPRSEQMARIKGKNTRPELIVRRALHAAGLRFRLQARELPGRPDIVFRSRRVAIFVQGCFWHRHEDPACCLTRTPKTRVAFWEDKFADNVARDRRDHEALLNAGWDVAVIWECQLKDESLLSALVARVNARPASRSPQPPPAATP